RTRENILHLHVQAPAVGVGSIALRADRLWCGQGQRGEHGVENVTTHIAEGASAKVEPFAPVARVVVAVADIGPLRRDAEPEVPVQSRRDRIALVRTWLAVAPLLAAPAIDLRDLANRAILNGLNYCPVDRVRVDLNAHLGDEFLRARNPSQ